MKQGKRVDKFFWTIFTRGYYYYHRHHYYY